MIKKMLVFSLVTAAFCSSAFSEEQRYIIEKVNKGTLFLKEGQQSAGFLTNNAACGASTTAAAVGGTACAVVTPLPGNTEPLYYLKKGVYVTGTPESGLVGFIEGSATKSSGMGGNTATGVFKVMDTINVRPNK